MKRAIGMDIHRTFVEVVFWEDGRLRQHGWVVPLQHSTAGL
jgi:hypothetical protein